MKDLINNLTRPNTVRFILVVGMLTLTALYGIALLFIPIPEQNRDFVNNFFIALISWTGAIIVFHFNTKANLIEPKE